MAVKTLVVINKDGGSLGVSETFLRNHIAGLTGPVQSLIGNPGYRRLQADTPRYLLSRHPLPLGTRWLIRRLGLSTVARQDRRALRNYLRREGIEVVLTEYGPTAVAVMGACQDAQVPLVAHFHGFDAYAEPILRQFRGAYRELFECAAAIVAVSRHMQEQLVALGAPRNKVHCNACGPELPEAPMAQPENAPERAVMLGRLTEKKAPHLAILAFARTLPECPQATLDVIGNGPLRGLCEQLAEALGIARRVRFHGPLEHTRALTLLARSRVFLQHSVRAADGDHEGTPVSVLEAMGLGLPVVATRHGGIADAVTSERYGSLVEELDLSGFARATSAFLTQPSLAGQVGEAARERIRSGWTAQQSLQRLDRIVQGAVPPVAVASRQSPVASR